MQARRKINFPQVRWVKFYDLEWGQQSRAVAFVAKDAQFDGMSAEDFARGVRYWKVGANGDIIGWTAGDPKPEKVE